MTPEEAALYQAFVVRVDHVAAYLLDGPFAWPSKEELLEAAQHPPSGTPAAAAFGAAAQLLSQLQQQTGAVVQHAQDGGAVSALQQLLAKRARVVPLLHRFGLSMDLQVATSVHPR